MKRLVLMIIPALICGVLFTSCGSDKAQTKDENDILHGKWQLISISPFNVEGVDLMLVDYSPKNIINEFKSNSVLAVSVNVDNDYGGLEIGKHFYEVTLTEVSANPLGLPAPHEVRINGISYGFGYMSDSP